MGLTKAFMILIIMIAGPTLSSKIEDCSHKEAFPRKVYCYEIVHHSMTYVSRNFQTNILIGS